MKQGLFLDVAESIYQNDKRLIQRNGSNNIKTCHFKVEDDTKKTLKRTKGDYFTISYDQNILLKFSKKIIKELETVLKTILKEHNKHGKTLIVGLGNSSILADALGPETTKKIIATNHYHDFLTIPKVALFVPEVISKTGISSFKLIKMLVENLKPDTIIVIDSLATTSLKRLNSCIEVSNTGIIPGGAIGINKMINEKTFNIPVISIGVPLMIDIDSNLFTTPNIHNVINLTTDIISHAINSIYLS